MSNVMRQREASRGSAMSNTAEGSCACGAVTFEAVAALQSVVNCHCNLCRRLSGGAFTTWVSFSKQGFTVSGESSLSSFAATQNVNRWFCSVCGTHVFTSDVRHPNILGVPAGIIRTSLSVEPQGHYFVSHKAAWHAISDSLAQFGGECGFEPMSHNPSIERTSKGVPPLDAAHVER